MGRPRRLAILAAVVIVISPLVAAQDFSVNAAVLPERGQVSPDNGEQALFNVTVENTGEEQRTVTLQLEARNDWYNGPYPYVLTLAPGETGNAIVYINLDENAVAGRKGVVIRATDDSGETVTERPSFSIVRDRNVLIKSFDVDNDVYDPGDTVTASVRVRNVVNHELNENEYRAVFSLDDRTETIPFSDLDPGEEETVTATFPLDRYAAGVKTVDVRVERIDGDLQEAKQAKVEVRTVEQVEHMQENKFRGVSRTTVLTTKNVGNVPAENAAVSAEIPSYLAYIVSFTEDPTTQTATGGVVRYSWDIGSMAPGDAYTVKYHVNYWAPLATLVILLLTAIVAVKLYRRPHIEKKTVRKNGKHSVHLTVKNRSKDTLDNVVVRDFVPSIATLIEKFDSSPPEKIRQGEEGTEIEWKLGRMNPGEERILTYKVSPQVEVEGNVTLPAARLEYKNGRKEKKQNSHHTTADFR